MTYLESGASSCSFEEKRSAALPIRAGDIEHLRCKGCGYRESFVWEKGQQEVTLGPCPDCEAVAWSVRIERPN